MTLVQQTVRQIDGGGGYTGLPLMPAFRLPQPGDAYPSSDVVQRSRRFTTGAAPLDTSFAHGLWIARMGGDTPGENIPNVLSHQSGLFSEPDAFICDPDLVDWGSVVLTGRRRSNAQNGRIIYGHSIGNATLWQAGFTVTLAVNPAVEQRQPIFYQNTAVEARKLAPRVHDADIDNMGYKAIYQREDLSPIFGGFPDVFILSRYLCSSVDDAYPRGSILVTDNDVDDTDVCSIYVAPVYLDAGNWVADFDAAVTPVGTIVPPGTFEIYPADMTAAGVVRWGFFYIWVTKTGGFGGPGTIYADYYSPVDVPPIYNCAGVDGMLKGGYLP